MTVSRLEVRRGPAVAVTVATAIASIAVIWVARWGPDWPAQEFRAWIAAHDGLSAWTSRWYGGSALPGYSILFPPLAKIVGAGGVGLGAAVLTAWAAAGLAPRDRARAAAYAVGVTVYVVETLVIGQVPFLLGIAFGVTAFRALMRGRSWVLVAVPAVLSSLATPLAGAFLVLVLPACAVSLGVRRAAPLAGGLVGAGVALAVGGATGPFPMPWELLLSTLAFCLLVMVLAPRAHRGLRTLAICYAMAALLVFAIPNPIGGNITRLGKLIAIPLVCHFLVLDRTRWLRLRSAAVAALAILWPAVPFVGSIANGAADPSRSAQFYSGMLTYLDQHRVGADRVEIPFTREHWEAYWVAKHVLIARGWERQTDYRYNEVLYHPLTPARYWRWLSDNAVDLVALPDVPIDVGGTAEATLLHNAPPYLQPVWHDAHWHIWRVRGATPLVTGAAVLRDLDPASVDLHFRTAGHAEVRVRYDPLWRVNTATACVGETPAGWIEVRARHPGNVDLRAEVGGQLLAPSSSC